MTKKANEQKYYYMYLSLIEIPPVTAPSQTPLMRDMFAVVDTAPTDWLIKMMDSGQRVTIKFFKEISKGEYDRLQKSIQAEQEKQKARVEKPKLIVNPSN